MITSTQDDLVRVTLTLPSVDVDLLDRLARLEGMNRSAEVRQLLGQFRPMLRATVEAFEAAEKQRSRLDQAVFEASAAQLAAVLPEVERIQDAMLGAMSRLEGAATAAAPAPTDDEAPGL